MHFSGSFPSMQCARVCVSYGCGWVAQFFFNEPRIYCSRNELGYGSGTGHVGVLTVDGSGELKDLAIVANY